MKLLWALLRFFRVINLLMIAILFWVVEYLLLEPLLSSRGLSTILSYHLFDLFVIDVVLVAAAGYMINDWYDRSIDRVNRPTRLLVLYQLTAKQFYGLYLSILLIGFVITVYVGIQINKEPLIVLYPLFNFLFWWYSSKGKKKGIIGNILVSISIAALPWVLVLLEYDALSKLSSIDISAVLQLLMHLSLFSILVALANFLREIVKDAEDAHGDSKNNVASFYLKNGLKKTKNLLFAIVLALLVVQVFLIVYTEWMTQLFLSLAFCSALLMGWMIYKVLKMKEKKHFSALSQLLKLIMLLGIMQIAFLNPY